MRSKDSGVTLVELLVVMVIMGIVSGMIISVWFALDKASAFSSTSDQQQGFGRDAISRMASEIRDAQSPGKNTTAFVVASPYEIDFYTTYNTAGASVPGTTPTLARFILKNDGAIYREWAGADGTFGTAGGVSSLLVSNVVNQSQNPKQDLFTYWAYNASGNLYPSNGTTTVIPASAIANVTITALVDLNPGRSPKYLTLQTTVQPRNVLQL